MEIKELKIEHDGRCNDGVFYIPDADTYPLIIMSHGYNGHASDFEKAGPFFAEHGIGVISYTFCGGTTRDTSGFPTTSMTLFTEKEDLLAVLRLAQSYKEVQKDSIFLFGASQGGMISALVAAEVEEEIRGLILQYPALCIPDDWNTHFKDEKDIPEQMDLWGMDLGHDFFATLRDFRVYETITTYKRPVLVMHGDQDAVVPVSYGIEAAGRYKNARLEIFHGEGHGFSAEGEKTMQEMVLAFIFGELH